MKKIFMKSRLVIVGSLLFVTALLVSGSPRAPRAPAATEFETRCGWFSNPTPANAWLYDRDGEWTIAVQGGHQADGDWPSFKSEQWVLTNAGSYGYGCACLRVSVNKQTHEVLEIKSSRARSLTQCRQDPTLKKWKSRLK